MFTKHDPITQEAQRFSALLQGARFLNPLKGISVLLRLLLVQVCILACLPAMATRAEDYEQSGSNRTIIVGGDRDYPPYEFLDKDGQPAGYNVDLSRAIADVMGMKVEFRFGGWSEMRNALMAGSIGVLEGISYSEDRTKTLSFSPPHTIINHAI